MTETFDINFGDRVAENEADSLASYFVRTEHWDKLRTGKIDVVFGSKGAGKSALYTLLSSMTEDLQTEGTLLLSAEKPTGQTVFSEIINTPPTSETEFVTLWKIYICQLVTQRLVDEGSCTGAAEEVRKALVDAGLLQEKNTLKRLVNSAVEFAKNLVRIESIEGSGGIEGSVTGKITFRTPSTENQRKGFHSVDELLDKLNEHLENQNLNTWILFDRLDVAFDQDPNLEKNALRALFKTYRDIEDLDHIFMKIFLRDDIWRRITDEGFRESSHITRTTTIKWSTQGLLNLIITRVLKNDHIIQHYGVDSAKIEKDHILQSDLYYKIFPRQVDVGEKQSDTFDWILNRARDGFGNAAPREVIHFHNEIVNNEKQLDEIGGRRSDQGNLFTRQAIKSSTSEVSKVKIELGLFAEHAHLKPYMLKLDGNKAEHITATLSTVWSTNPEIAKQTADKLVDIGFFEQRAAREEGLYKIPFLYRPYLRITQGKAF